MQNQPRIFIYTALSCEAKAFISRLQLKKNVHIGAFAIYTNTEVCLTVTGPGKSAMAAGVAFSLATFGGVDFPILMNIGIAGHLDLPLGQLIIANKITDAETGKNFYPPFVIDLPCNTAPVLTVATPESQYLHACLYDMEASAFYETAVKFSTAELIYSVKVISDNQVSPTENIKQKKVAGWIADHADSILEVLEKLQQLAQRIESREPCFYRIYSHHWHFTVNQKQRLKELLSRWEVVSKGKDPELNLQLINAKAVLYEIEKKVSALDYFL